MLTVVTGPPCSGKTTWVAEHARHGDIVIDLDHLAAALTPTDDEHTYPPHVRAVARRARIAAIDAALPQHAAGHRVWIIDTAPTREQRAYYHRRNAEFVTLRVDPAELARRRANRADLAQPANT